MGQDKTLLPVKYYSSAHVRTQPAACIAPRSSQPSGFGTLFRAAVIVGHFRSNKCFMCIRVLYRHRRDTADRSSIWKGSKFVWGNTFYRPGKMRRKHPDTRYSKKGSEAIGHENESCAAFVYRFLVRWLSKQLCIMQAKPQLPGAHRSSAVNNGDQSRYFTSTYE